MKRLIYLAVIVLSIMGATSSCSDYLEKAPGVDVTEDTIFSTVTNVETFVAGTYFWGLLGDLGYWDPRDKSDCISDAATDAAEIAMTWYWTQAWNTASMSPSNTLDRRFDTHWTAIRRTNTIIERIEDAPFNDNDYKRQVMGEAKFLRAYNYWQLFIKYGGVPILRARVGLGDDFRIPRSTVAETVEFMIEDCNDAIAKLPAPNEYQSNLRGRATNVAAMALKSRILLYAASPTFNTDSPYLNFGANNNLICYGNYDPNRWKLAADAAKEAIDAALAGGHNLITDQGVESNYQYAWETPDNIEIILAEKSHGTCWHYHFPWGSQVPQSAGGFGGGLNLTFNFLKKYEKKDGTPQEWNMEGGDDLMKKYEELDPRFKQTVVYQGKPWNSYDKPIMDFTSASVEAGTSDGVDKCITGMLVHKPVPYALSSRQGMIPNGIIFRMAELYLNYAEALNEYNAAPPQAAYDAINAVRQRSGMPKLNQNLTTEEFREKVRNERAVELAFEGHRLWDIRRWEIADEDGVMQGDMLGLRIQVSEVNKNDYHYEPEVFETRSFNKRMYRHPFSVGEMEKGYLIQNPGYN